MSERTAGFKTVVKEAAEHLGWKMSRSQARAAGRSLAELKDRPLKEIVRGDFELGEDEMSLLFEAIATGQAARLD